MSPSTVLDALISHAFFRADVSRANAAIDEQRQARGSASSPALSYEVALPALAPEVYLSQKLLPKLVYFLDCRGVRAPHTPGVFVSLFTTDGLYFIEAGTVISVLAEARGLDLAEVLRRYGENGAGDPALLGG